MIFINNMYFTNIREIFLMYACSDPVFAFFWCNKRVLLIMLPNLWNLKDKQFLVTSCLKYPFIYYIVKIADSVICCAGYKEISTPVDEQSIFTDRCWHEDQWNILINLKRLKWTQEDSAFSFNRFKNPNIWIFFFRKNEIKSMSSSPAKVF